MANEEAGGGKSSTPFQKRKRARIVVTSSPEPRLEKENQGTSNAQPQVVISSPPATPDGDQSTFKTFSNPMLNVPFRQFQLMVPASLVVKTGLAVLDRFHVFMEDLQPNPDQAVMASEYIKDVAAMFSKLGEEARNV